MSREEVEDMLRWKSIKATVFGKDALLLTIQVVPDVFEQQRSLIEFDSKGFLSFVNIRIIPETGSSGEDVMLLYNNVREWMINELGPPAWERREGYAVPEDLLQAFSRGKVVRFLQWEKTYAIRFGIPQRANGEVMVEILIAPKMLPRGSKFWGGRRF